MVKHVPPINPDLDRMPSEGHAMSEPMTNEASLIKALKSVQQNRDALQARCDELEAAARMFLYNLRPDDDSPFGYELDSEMLGELAEGFAEALDAKPIRSVVEGGK